MFAQVPRSLENDALAVLAGRVDGETLSAEQWQTVGDYLKTLAVESYSTDEDAVELCPRCGCVLVHEDGDYWVCSGALYETEAILDDDVADDEPRPLAERLWILSEQPDEIRQLWLEQCGSSRVFMPSRQPRRSDFLSMLPDQLPWALSFTELVSRMATLYEEAGLSTINSTVRPKHLRRELDHLRITGVIGVLVGNDGIARFYRVGGAVATSNV